MNNPTWRELKDYIHFKHERDEELVEEMNALIAIVMFQMALWCNVRSIPFVVTSTISTEEIDTILGRISTSHRDRRAFDLRSKVFTREQKAEFMRVFNEKFKDIASISLSDFQPRLVVLHGEDEEEHFHVAIHSQFAITKQLIMKEDEIGLWEND